MRVRIFLSFTPLLPIFALAQEVDVDESVAREIRSNRVCARICGERTSVGNEISRASSPDIIRQNMERLSAHPHAVGQPYDKDNAEWMLALFKQWGFDAHIETFDVLFPTPKERVVELVAPTKFVASLREPPVAEDPTSGQTAEQLPTYNAYSADGDVTAPLVYVNYGMRDDYDKLERMGISVKGAIVIARYGGAWRGIKPKVAAEHGAIGCIIYSDPAATVTLPAMFSRRVRSVRKMAYSGAA